MKKLFLLSILLAFTFVLNAKKVEVIDASSVANFFVEQKFDVVRNKSKVLILAHTFQHTKSSESSVAYYVFNVGDNQGFVIVSGDDIARPILGYSTQGQYEHENLPPNFADWIEDIGNAIAATVAQQYESSEQIQGEWAAYMDKNASYFSPQRSSNAIEPLIQTKWDQDNPYNLQCPVTDGYYCYTGCVATAMAQIMKYYNHPVQGTGTIPAYYTNTNGTYIPAINLDTQTPYDWDNMVNIYYNVSTTQAQKNAVAQLMYHCGASVKMDYTPQGSGAGGIRSAAINYFGYDRALRYERREDYSDTQWISMLKQELDAGRPVYHSGASNTGAHAFICDGYDNQDYFHFNWGWSGSSDGYFTVTPLPNYPYSNSIYVNFKPDEGAPCIPISQGTTGNLTWKISCDTLTINGSGAMPNYTSFSAPWFVYKENIMNVVIGDSVTSIGSNAFYYFSNLTEITIPNSVTTIGTQSFFGCFGLTALTIPNSVTSIESWAFGDCYGLSEITCHRTTPPAIQSSTFVGVSNSIPVYVSCASQNAYKAHTYWGQFTNYQSEDIAIPQNVTVTPQGNSLVISWQSTGTPSYKIYRNNVYLATVTTTNYTDNNVPATILCCYQVRSASTMCDGILSEATCNLSPVCINGSISPLSWEICSGKLTISGSGAMPNYTRGNAPWYAHRNIIKELEIGNSVTKIGDNAFYNCYNLTKATIGNSIASLGIASFYNCIALETVHYNAANAVTSYVNYLDELWLWNTPSLSSVIIGENVQTIPSYAFMCANLKEVTIGDSVTSIGERAFIYCTGLEEVIIGSSVASVGERAFYECTGLKEATIGSSVTSIGNYAFSYCSDLTSVTSLNPVPQNISYVFFSTDLSNATLIVPCKSISQYSSAAVWQDFGIITGGDNCYALTVNGGQGSGNYLIGEIVNITANTAPSGKAFDKWTGNVEGVTDVTSANTTYTMSSADANVTATYKNNTGINEVLLNSISIYPNPVKEKLFIINNEQLIINNVEICDIAGRTVETQNFASLQGGTTINVSNLPQGVYLVKIHTDKGIATKRVIKI